MAMKKKGYAKGGAMKKKGYAKGGVMKKKPVAMSKGSKLKMVEKGGKKVPFFAADGVGKMKDGGATKPKKRPAAMVKPKPRPESEKTKPKRGDRARNRKTSGRTGSTPASKKLGKAVSTAAKFLSPITGAATAGAAAKKATKKMGGGMMKKGMAKGGVARGSGAARSQKFTRNG